VNLTQQEVRFLETLAKQIKEGTSAEQALKNMGRAMGGQKYILPEHMQVALRKLGTKLGYSEEALGRAVAPHLPAAAEVKMPAEAEAAAQVKAAGKAFRFVKWGGRALLVIGLAVDAYEVYRAESKTKAITKKVGAWSASLGLGGAAAEEASPLLAAGPWGWAGYALVVGGAGVAGYFIGEEVTETVYKWTFE
jgi:hypothetical protein